MVNLNTDNSYHSLKYQKVITVVLAGFLACIGLPHVVFAGADPDSPKYNVPTVANLDFDKVGIVLHTTPEFDKRLHERLIRTLRAAGIYKGEAEKPTAMLTFNLDPRSLGLASCKGGFLYDPSLELKEEVTIKRNGVTTWASTWVLFSIPYAIESITVDKLEAEMDELLRQFIIAYRMGNPQKQRKQ
jgi:hypothetical protein